jgi:hypothetical protein
MAVRRSKQRSGAERRERMGARGRRLYLTWVIGIIIGALGLKPTSINAAGLSLSIERPEIIQGIVFLMCLWQTYIWFGLVFQLKPYTGRDELRDLLWRFLPAGRKSFLNGTVGDYARARRKTKSIVRLRFWLILIIMAVPACQILAFNRQQVSKAFHAIVPVEVSPFAILR